CRKAARWGVGKSACERSGPRRCHLTQHKRHDGAVMVRSTQRRRRARRDRHGRGLRGLLYPSDLPAARSRAERFDALVLEALEPIEARWRTELTDLDVAVDDVPDLRLNPDHSVVWEDGVLEDHDVPLARLVPAGVDRRGQPTRARIVVYPRAVEGRGRGRRR